MKRFCLGLLLFCCGFFVTAQPAIDVQHYRYEIELSDNTNAITGKATIAVRFLENATWFQLNLASATSDDGLVVYQVTGCDVPLTATHQNNLLTIHLKKAAEKFETRIFEINYMGVPTDGLVISKNKFGERTFFADNWPNRAHYWLPCNDTPADKSSVEFIVTAPAHYKVIANGLLQQEKQLNNSQKITHWKETLPIPAKVMVIGVAQFAVKRVDDHFHVPVTAWVYPQDSTRGFYDYALADNIMQFFENYVGSYPFKKLANVQSTTMFGGMENANAIFYAENTVTGNRSAEALMAHEIAHQWFGNSATETDFAHLWLSEGFATYLTDLYIENKYGVDSFKSRMEAERSQVLHSLQAAILPVVDSATPYMQLLNANSYQKGAWVLHMLRNEVGDSKFQQIIQQYYKTYRFSNADTKNFQAVAEAVTGKDLNWFFDQWLYRPGFPELAIKMTVDGEAFELHVTQLGKVYQFPLQVKIINANQQAILRTLQVTEKTAELKLKSTGPFYIEIDPNRLLLYKEKK